MDLKKEYAKYGEKNVLAMIEKQFEGLRLDGDQKEYLR